MTTGPSNFHTKGVHGMRGKENSLPPVTIPWVKESERKR